MASDTDPMLSPESTEVPSGPLPSRILLVGFAGSIAAVIGGSLAGAGNSPTRGSSLPWSAPFLPLHPRWNAIAAVALFFAGLALLCRAWLRLRVCARSSSFPLRGAVIACALWSLPLVAGPPLASRDVYSYVALGEVANTNVNPYVSSVDPPGGVAGGAVDPIWNKGATPYGPLFTIVAKVAVAHSGNKLVTKTLAFRLLAMLSVAAAGFGLVVIARRRGRSPAEVLVLALANPLILLHFVSGAHNDSFMVALLIAGLAISEGSGRRRWLAALVLCGLAAAVKAPALVAIGYLGIVGPRGVRRRKTDVPLAAVVGLGTLHLLGMATGYGWAWARNMVGSPSVLSYLSPATVLAVPMHWLSTILGVDSTVTGIAGVLRLIGVVGAIISVGWLLTQSRTRGLAALTTAMLVLALFGPAVQPWYLTWGLVIGAVASAGRAGYTHTLFSVIALFTVLPAGPDLGVVLIRLGSPIGLVLVGCALLPLTFRVRRHLPKSARAAVPPIDVTIVVPTRNEAECVRPLLDRLLPVLAGVTSEVLFVDDSDDVTPAVVQMMAAQTAIPVRLMHRNVGYRYGGLGGAVVEGLRSAHGRTVIVMDADLQHPPEAIPSLLTAARIHPSAIIVGTRTPEGAAQGLDRARVLGSRAAARLARTLFPGPLTGVADPMSGLFALPRHLIDPDRLNPFGFKILVELLVNHPDLAVEEVEYDFAKREAGVSKAGITEAMSYVGHLADLRIRTLPPWRTHPTLSVSQAPVLATN